LDIVAGAQARAAELAEDGKAAAHQLAAVFQKDEQCDELPKNDAVAAHLTVAA